MKPGQRIERETARQRKRETENEIETMIEKEELWCRPVVYEVEDLDVGCGESVQPGQRVHLNHSYLDHYLFRVLREGLCML